MLTIVAHHDTRALAMRSAMISETCDFSSTITSIIHNNNNNNKGDVGYCWMFSIFTREEAYTW